MVKAPEANGNGTTDARSSLIRNRVEDWLAEERLRVSQVIQQKKREFASRNTLRSTPMLQVTGEEFWASVRRTLCHRLQLEKEIPGGLSPSLRDDLHLLLTRESAWALASVNEIADLIKLTDRIPPYLLEQQAEIEVWLGRQIQIIEDEFALGLLQGQTSRGMNIGTLVIGTNNQVAIDPEVLEDLISLLSTRLQKHDTALTQELRAIADAVKANRRPSNLQKAADTIKAMENWRQVLGPAFRIVWPLLQSWVTGIE
ncbi:MAG TPA: hypothetical protein VD969_19625 [Symbiobacteriaceae bacterium]|nr:hypothetical protein [Symbiobacteriaceae bacterium]